MGRKKRAPCCDSSQVKKGPWSEAEDEKLKHYILRNGHDNWRMLPQLAGLRRCGKSCRLRWLNYLRPGLKRGDFTEEEEDAIVQLHHTLGNRWSKIAGHFPGRTDNEIKNVWNTRIKKRLVNSSPSSSSEVTNSQASSAYSSSASLVSLVCNDVANSEKQTQEEQFQKILEDMACGFEMNAPQSLEFLFKDPNIPPPPPTSQAESLAVQIESAGNDFWSQMLEPGLDDYNEWLNYLDNHT